MGKLFLNQSGKCNLQNCTLQKPNNTMYWWSASSLELNFGLLNTIYMWMDSSLEFNFGTHNTMYMRSTPLLELKSLA